MFILIIIASIVIAFLTIYFVWRKSSRRLNLPCPLWLRWAVEIENPFAKSNQSQYIIKGLNVHPGMTVLDIGCGPGRLSIPLAKSVGSNGKVVAVDIQPEMLEIVKEKAEKNNLNNIDLLNLAMGENKFTLKNADRAVLATVLGEIPNREAALKEIHDALKPSGILAITEIVLDPHFQTKKTILNLTRNIGFTEMGYMGNMLAYTIYLKRN